MGWYPYFLLIQRNHPLEIYLDVMEATRHVLEKKLKKKGQAMSNAFHRMEGAFLLWAKEGYEVIWIE